jgi:hypothetical protein
MLTLRCGNWREWVLVMATVSISGAHCSPRRRLSFDGPTYDLVILNGKLVDGVTPGQPVRAAVKVGD